MVKKIVIVFFIFLLFLLPSYSTSADDSSEDKLTLPKQSIYPGSFIYPIKRLYEKTRIVVSFSEKSKTDYNLKLLKNRLSELHYVVDNRLLDEMERSSGRVSAKAGILTEALLVLDDQEIKKSFASDLGIYLPLLIMLRDRFPANSSNWLFIQYNIDTFNNLISKLE